MCFAWITYSVFSSEFTWLLLLPVPTAPPDVWHVILLDHMVSSADAVLYIPNLLCGRRVLNTSRDTAYVLLDVFLMEDCFSKCWVRDKFREVKTDAGCF